MMTSTQCESTVQSEVKMHVRTTQSEHNLSCYPSDYRTNIDTKPTFHGFFYFCYIEIQPSSNSGTDEQTWLLNVLLTTSTVHDSVRL
jgi:hypothetical protein